jgi:hypothetical protein
MQKSLANGRLPGVLPGAEYPANLLIANDPARALAPGKLRGAHSLVQPLSTFPDPLFRDQIIH